MSAYLIGIAGRFSDALAFLEWFRHGKCEKLNFIQYAGRDSDAPDFVALAVSVMKSNIEYWTEYLQPEPRQEPFVAIGTGAKAALAAMHMGATAAESIRVAAKVDAYTNDDVFSISLGQYALELAEGEHDEEKRNEWLAIARNWGAV